MRLEKAATLLAAASVGLSVQAFDPSLPPARKFNRGIIRIPFVPCLRFVGKNLRSRPKEEELVRKWREDFCNIARRKFLFGDNKNGDLGEWSLTKTRRFYLDNLERALNALEKSGIPVVMWGDLAHEVRETLKSYTRERSKITWRCLARRLAGKSRTLDEYKEYYRNKLDTEGLSKEEINVQVSIDIYESAKRTRHSVNTFLEMLCYLELWFVDPSEARLITKEELMSVFLLPEDKPGLLPASWRYEIREILPKCARSFNVTIHRRRAEDWQFLGEKQLVPGVA